VEKLLHLRHADRPRDVVRGLQEEAADLAGGQAQLHPDVALVVDLPLREPLVPGLPDDVQRHSRAVAAEHGAVLGEVELAVRPAVVEPGRDLHLEGHPAANAPHDPDQAVGVGRGGVARHRHEVDDLADALLGQVPGEQDRRVRQVHLLGGERPARRADPVPATAALVEQRTEHRRRVEPREAEPVDRTVEGYQGRRLQVTDQPVVRDRRIVVVHLSRLHGRTGSGDVRPPTSAFSRAAGTASPEGSEHPPGCRGVEDGAVPPRTGTSARR
jgi:hypothetical protein